MNQLKFPMKWSAVLVSSAFSGLMAVSTLSVAQSPVGLLDVYQMASLQDASLAQVRAQYQADQQNLDTAFAALLPTIQADASYAITDSSRDLSDVTSREVSLTLNQSLFRYETRLGYEQVEKSVAASKLNLQAAEQDLVLRVTEHYFSVLLAQKTLVLFQAKEKADKSQLERAEASAEVGLASRVDVLQAKSSFDLSKSERINAENNLDISFEKLMKITGKPIRSLKAFPDKVILPTDSFDMAELTQKAEKNNIQVQQAVSQLETATLEVDVQKGGYWPQVNFQAKVADTAYSDYNAGSTFNDSQRTSLAVTLSLPLYEGGATQAKVAAARFSKTAAKEGLRNSQEEARLNARVQARNLKRGESLVAALQEAVNSNDAFVEAAEEGYKVGLKSMLEVLSARSNQTAARKNLVESLHQQVLNKLRLESSIGDLTTDDLQAFDALLQEIEVIRSESL